MTPADPRRVRLVSEGVVASYIHDISARTGSGATTPAPERRIEQTRRALRQHDGRVHARRRLTPVAG
jgi:hypothetical protein